MPGAHFSVQNYLGSRLELSAVWAGHKLCWLASQKYQGLLFTIKIPCQISVPFFQDGSFSWGLKRKGYFSSFSFLFLIGTVLNVNKK